MNPYDALDFGCAMVQQQVFETLYRREGSDIVPWLARGMPQLIAGSKTRYEIAIRDDIRFSDGTPMHAMDVIASLRHTRRFAKARQLQSEGHRVFIELEHPDPGLASALSAPRASVCMEHIGGLDEPSSWLGTGPWMAADEFAPDDAHLVPNPFHWGKRPALSRLRFRQFQLDSEGHPDSLVQAIESGDADLTIALSTRDARRVQNARHIIRPGTSTALLWMNLERMDSPHVREAICYAIDRYGLAEKSYLHPERFAAQSVLPPGMQGRNDRFAFDRERSLRCLREHGPVETALRMLVIWGPRAYLPAPRNWARSIKEMLERAGIQVQVVMTQDAQDYQAQIRGGDYDLVLGGWLADSEDPCDFVEALFDPVVIPQPDDVVATGCNFARVDDPELTQQLASYRETRSSNTLDALLARAESLMAILPLAYGPTIAVHGWHLAGFRTGPTGVPDFVNLRMRD